MKKALTIAGSDSGGGAGIEADLKTFASFGVHGLVAITSVTAQNTQEVRAIYDVSPDVVAKQIEAVADDIGVDAAKTGMLSNAEIIKSVAKTVKKYRFPLVVDPVMIAKSGAPLLREDAVMSLIEHIIPLATLVTPNIPEAEKLSGISIKDIEDARLAAKIIVEELGANAAIVKGGHLKGNEAVDVLYYDGKFREYRAPFVDGGTHGTGCSFSAAITANLARGADLEKAIAVAKKFITMGIYYGVKIGRGHCPVNQNAWRDIPAEKWRIYEELLKIRKIIAKQKEASLLYALPLPYAKDEANVCMLKEEKIEFKAPKHLVPVLFEYMKKNSEIRSALFTENGVEIGRSPQEILKKLGLI